MGEEPAVRAVGEGLRSARGLPLHRRSVLGRNLTHLSGGFRRRLRRYQADGLIRRDLDPRVLALALAGLVLLVDVVPALRAPGSGVERSSSQQAVSIFLNGVLPRP